MVDEQNAADLIVALAALIRTKKADVTDVSAMDLGAVRRLVTDALENYGPADEVAAGQRWWAAATPEVRDHWRQVAGSTLISHAYAAYLMSQPDE